MPFGTTNLRSKIDYALTMLRYAWTVRGDGKVKRLENSLPNSGGFPVDEIGLETPTEVFASIDNQHRRATNKKDFEGLALDDALAYTNGYKHYSFLRLAKAIAKIAREQTTTSQVSVLELGCGGGDMWPFFRALGIGAYLGVDGNPIAFNHSPYMRKNPEHFRLLNLSEEINFGMKFTVVCTFEVLEHIHEDRLDFIVRTVTNHLTHHSVFLGTASLQDDLDVHVTVKPRQIWLEKFAQHGLVVHEKHKEYETLLTDNHPFNWNGNNTNVFALKFAE